MLERANDSKQSWKRFFMHTSGWPAQDYIDEVEWRYLDLRCIGWSIGSLTFNNENCLGKQVLDAVFADTSSES